MATLIIVFKSSTHSVWQEVVFQPPGKAKVGGAWLFLSPVSGLGAKAKVGNPTPVLELLAVDSSL